MHRRTSGVALLVCLALATCVTSAYAAGTRVQVDSLPATTAEVQTILDVHSDRILFLEGTGPDASPEAGVLKIKDRATGEITTMPGVPAQIPRYGFLTSHGAIFVNDSYPTYPYNELWEWRDGALIDLGGANSGSSLRVKGRYAIWNNGRYLYRRDLTTGTTITVTDNAGNTENDLAANGHVAYWAYPAQPYTVHLYRNGSTVQLTEADPLVWSTYPLTDGINVAYRKTNRCCGPESGRIAVHTPAGEVVLDSLRNDWPEPHRDYDVAGGWVAYTRLGASNELQVWIRDPSGNESQLSPTGSTSRIVAISPDGEVMFHSPGHLYLGQAGSPSIDFGPEPSSLNAVTRVFWQDGNWFETFGGILYRLDVIGRPAIVGGPSGHTTATTAAFDFTSAESAPTFDCRLDAGAFASCTSPRSYAGLSDGTHRFEVRLTSAGADPTATKRIWTVDTTAPAPFDLQLPGASGVVPRNPAFTWDETTDATTSVDHYELLVDGSSSQELPPASCAGGTCSTGLASPLADGPHSWQVRATDALGNVRASETRNFTVVDPPSATLTVAPLLALTGEQVSFDASGSSDPNGAIARYQWDLDGDGSFEGDTGTNPRTSHVYSTRLDATVRVRVSDSGGSTAEAGQALVVTKVSAAGHLGISINGGATATNDPDVQVSMVWPTRAIKLLISNDGGFGAPGIFPVDTPIPWRLASSGPQLLPKTVYVRFSGGDSGRETYTDDIILDETQPTIQSATARLLGSRSGASTGKAGGRIYAVRIRARDGVTGVTGVQIANNRRKPGKVKKVKRARRFAGSVRFKSRGRRIYVRARDAVGNFSRWQRARIAR